MKRIIVILLSFGCMQAISAQGGGPGSGPNPYLDSNFVKALKDFNKDVIDNNNQIRMDIAQTLTGDFDCSGRSIQSLNGIQFFPNLNSVNARNNNIPYFPDVQGPRSMEWQSLDLDSNKLNYLPFLGNFGRLKKLDVSHNQLSNIPSLDGQSLLEVFNCADNNLSSLASNLFSNTKNLKQLNLSRNRLAKIPELSSNKQLEMLNISYNPMVSAPDLSNLTNLQQVSMIGANFTFRNLVPSLPTSSVPSFDLPPFKKLPRGADTTVQENQTLVLKTFVDNGVRGTKYTWFKGNTLIGTDTLDSFQIANIQLDQAGSYYCQITNRYVPQCTLITDTFKVHVSTCLDIASAHITITGINCQQNGTVQIKMNSLSGQDLTYTLKSSLSTLTNKQGLFKGLTEPSYQLLISNGPNCQKTYPDPILIPTQECIEAFITLDNDGEKDSYYFAQQGPVKIYTTNGTLVKTLTAPAHWDGSSKTASRVAPGYYLADVNNGEAMVKITVVY